MAYPKVVQQIHHEFNTASDNALKQAKEIINGNYHLLEKADKLHRIGFVNSHEVHNAKHIKINADIAQLIEYYRIKYPNNKFITEEQVLSINKKYNLVCAPIDRYKGFVPVVKLNTIASFKVQSDDKKENVLIVKDFQYSNVQGDLIKEFKRLYPNNQISKSEHHTYTSFVKIKGESLFIGSYTEINNDTFFICAPKKDIDLKGLSKIGALFQSITTVKVPDPVVLQPVKGGYLIVAAWGDEASDEIVINEAMN